MGCKVWIEKYLRVHGPITPAEVYGAGKVLGYSRRDIKAARRWHGKLIDTKTCGGETLWRWNQ